MFKPRKTPTAPSRSLLADFPELYQRQIHSEVRELDEWEAISARRSHHRKFYMDRAHRAVAKAVRAGDLYHLPHPWVHCVDCGKPAIRYDHRDYSKPLDVRAVCGGCNWQRGQAKSFFPLDIPTEFKDKEEYEEPDPLLDYPSQQLKRY